MATTMTIESYTAASTIDPVNDLLLEYQNSSGTYKSINRNTFLGLASVPLGLTDTQSPTNKTIGNTNTITIKDGSFTIQNSTTTTKQVVFSAASITTGQTRTITIPDASGTLGLLGSTQTWSGVNTFSGSTWSGGTISNASISADTVTGFTVSNSGNIYGIAVTTGVITGASTVGTTALVTNAVQGNQIATSAIKLGYAELTTTFSTTTASAYVDVTGLSVTVTVPAGGRDVLLTFMGVLNHAGTTGVYQAVALFEGSTILNMVAPTQVGTAYNIAINLQARVSAPTAGSHTYKVSMASNSTAGQSIQAGTGLFGQSAYRPFILVELI